MPGRAVDAERIRAAEDAQPSLAQDAASSFDIVPKLRPDLPELVARTGW
jgi:hypothetical protein